MTNNAEVGELQFFAWKDEYLCQKFFWYIPKTRTMKHRGNSFHIDSPETDKLADPKDSSRSKSKEFPTKKTLKIVVASYVLFPFNFPIFSNFKIFPFSPCWSRICRISCVYNFMNIEIGKCSGTYGN